MSDGVVLGPNAVNQIRELIREFYAQVDPSSQLGSVQPIESRKPIVIGKTDAAHNKGATGTISVYKGSSSGGYTLTDTGENITAYNRFGNIASGRWVAVRRMIHGWEIISAECT
jgi:hypothetical protein